MLKKVLLLFVFSVVFFVKKDANCFAEENDSFYSLKFNEVNLRAGPSVDFPVILTYKIKYLPVKVVAEYSNWYKIVDMDGDSGWVKNYLLSKAQTVLIIEDVILYSNPYKEAYPKFKIEKNTIFKLLKCKKDRCKVKIDKKIIGWIDKDSFWGNKNF